MGTDLTGKWSELDTYGGKLTENLTQAVSRDILVYGMQTIRARYPEVDIVGHIHDETVNEVPVDDFWRARGNTQGDLPSYGEYTQVGRTVRHTIERGRIYK